MEIIIKIPKEIYTGEQTTGMLPILVDAIGKGIPLPKGHGRIIDESQIRHIEVHTERELYGDKIRYVKVTDAPTIIEADKGVLAKINEKQNSLRATCKAWEEAINRDGYVN